jgi:beta-lactam-binding protein with PASTA domain/predicted Ser/Thr protein kinase
MPADSAPIYNGRYELVRQIARGGMAEVYLAHDLLLDRPVALKVLFPELSVDRSFVERFRREAQAAAGLSHPNIVSVFDWGEADHTYFIVMEYVDGRPLSAVIRAEAPLLPDRAAGIGAGVAAALSFAHRHGVIHRDIKPGNVLLTEDGQVKVADFGIARAANVDEALTQTGAVMGTATYFSPEQAQGGPVDARSDLYSLGVVLYEMVTGRPPFTADSPLAIAYKHVQESPPRPRELNPAIPAEFEAIVWQAIAKDPKQRYQSAQDLRQDLVRFQQGRPVLAPLVSDAPVTEVQQAAATAMLSQATGARTGVRTAVQPTVRAPRGTEPEDRPPRTGIYVALLLVLLGATAAVVVLALRDLGFFAGGAPATFQVPDVISTPLAQARALLVRDGLRVKVDPVAAPSGTVPGIVIGQSPQAPARVQRGQTVTLEVSTSSSPTPSVAVPDVTCQGSHGCVSAVEAGYILGRAGLSPGTITYATSETVPSGDVIRTSPPPGTSVPKGSVVNLVVSSGPPPTTTTTVPPASTTTVPPASTTTVPPASTTTTTSTTVPTTTTFTLPGSTTTTTAPGPPVIRRGPGSGSG